MLHSPEAIQKQLSDAVSIIGRYDFPNKWPDLISQMVEKFATGTDISMQLVLNAYKVLHPLMIDTVSFSSKIYPLCLCRAKSKTFEDGLSGSQSLDYILCTEVSFQMFSNM
jgi:hypothetical protein